MNLTRLTPDQVTNLSDAALVDVRDRAAYNATLVENRPIVGDGEAQAARRLRSLQHAAERELANRRRKPADHRQRTSPSLEGFIAFTERFPPAKRYNWIDCDNCLLAAYAQSLGLDYAAVSRTPIPAPADWTLEEPFTLDYLALMSHPNTYGAAAGYARALIAIQTTSDAKERPASWPLAKRPTLPG